MTYSNTEELITPEYIYNDNHNDEQKAVVRILIGEEEWFMDWNDYQLAQEEGRTKPVIYKNSLILVDDETYDDLQKLNEWIKNN